MYRKTLKWWLRLVLLVVISLPFEIVIVLTPSDEHGVGATIFRRSVGVFMWLGFLTGFFDRLCLFLKLYDKPFRDEDIEIEMKKRGGLDS